MSTASTSEVHEPSPWKALGIVLCLAGFSAVVAAEPVRTLEQDAKQLEGKWAQRGSGYEWIINLDPNKSVQIAISWKARGGTWAATGWTWSVKENERGRYIELDEATAKASDLPQELHYTLTDGKLILIVPDGPLMGDHAFQRDTGQPRGGSWWLSIGIGVLVGAILILLVFRSSKRGSPQELSDSKESATA